MTRSLAIAGAPTKSPLRGDAKITENDADNDSPPRFRVRMFFHCVEEGQRKLLCSYSWRLNSADTLPAIMTRRETSRQNYHVPVNAFNAGALDRLRLRSA